MRYYLIIFSIICSSAIAQVVPNQAFDIGNITGSVTLPNNASTESTQQLVLSTLSSFAPGGTGTVKIQDGLGNPLTSQLNGTQQALDVGINVGGIQVDPRTRTWSLLSGTDSITAFQGGSWTTARSWTLSSPGDSVAATQSGTWTTGRTWSLLNTTDSVNAVQSGPWTVLQGSAPWSVSQSGTWSLGAISGPIALPTGAATDASLVTIDTDLKANQPRNLYDGAGNALTSQVSGIRRALDVGIDVAGVQVDPRTRTWNLSSGSDSVASAQSGSWTTGRTWTIGSGTDSVSSVQSGSWTTGRTWSLVNTSDSVNAVQSGSWTVLQGAAPWSVSQSGTWTTGRTWNLSSGADSIAAVQSGSWSFTQSGTASQNLAQVGGTNVSTGTGASGAGIPRVTVSNDSQIKTWDGTNGVTYKAASTAAGASDTSEVVALSPNTPLPAGTNIIGKIELDDGAGTSVTVGQKASTSSLPVVMASWSYTHVAGAATTTVKNSAGVLHSICLNSQSGTTTPKDNTTTIAVINNSGTPNCMIFDVAFATSLIVVTTNGANDVTVIYQ